MSASKDWDSENWNQYIQTVEPLKNRPQHSLPNYQRPQKPNCADVLVCAKKLSVVIHPGKHSAPTKPQRTIDLHGYTEQTVFEVLEAFLKDGYIRGLRFVLVITGKGKSDGVGSFVLREEIPRFLTSPRMQMYVHSFQIALPQWGGAGALQVRLKSSQKRRM